MSDTTTYGRLYLIALRSFERMELQFYPEKLTLNRQPNVQQVEIVGRNLPRLQTQGSDRVLTFDIDFYAQEGDKSDVIRRCLWLESLTYRDGDNPPERVRLVFGRMFQRDVWAVRSFTYDLSMFDQENSQYPRQANGQLTLVQDGDLEPQASDIRDFYQ